MDRRICTYNDATHTYFLDGEKVISVTQLLAEQNITPNFSKVPVDPAVLSYATERGTVLHEEIQNFIEEGIDGFSDEFQYFKACIYPLREKWFSEVLVYCDDYAGRCDLIGVSANQPTLVVDTKTGSSWTRNSVAWQTSLYARCLPELVGDNAEMKCLDLKNFKLVDLERVDEKEVQKLLECHKNGEVYQAPQLAVTPDAVKELLALEQAVIELENTTKSMKEARDALRENFKLLFIQQGVKEYESPQLKITYIAPSTRDGGVDSARLKKDLPEIYAQYHKPDVAVKDSVRITIRSAS